MFTLHHGFWMYFFSRRHSQVWQFVIGSMLPDYIYGVLIFLMVVRGQVSLSQMPSISPQVLMSFLPLYPWVVIVDLLGHSIVIWGIIFLLTLTPFLMFFRRVAVGWGGHLLVDSVTHGAYANYYLYPLSLVAFHSPVSYWEPQFFAHEFKVVNGTLMGIAVSYLIYHWLRKKYGK